VPLNEDCWKGLSYVPAAYSHQLSCLGWFWNTWDCSSGPSLISDYKGTATAYGLCLKNHLASLG
jgi:endoglucanase